MTNVEVTSNEGNRPMNGNSRLLGVGLVALASLGGVGPATAQIQYQVSINNSADIVEGDSGTVDAVFTVSVSPPIPGPNDVIEVSYSTDSAQPPVATAGVDYQMTTGTQFLDIATQSFQIIVPVLGDTLQEPDERFSVFIGIGQSTTLPGAFVAQGEGTALIVDDDSPPPALPPVDVTVVAPTLSEGDTGVTSFPFQIELSRPVDGSETTLVLEYATADGTATAPDDYQAHTGTLSFPPGSGTQATIAVLINGDDIVEPDETFALEVSVVLGNGTVAGSSIATIQNDDQVPIELTFVANAYSAPEGSRVVSLRVARIGPSAGAVSVLARTNLKGKATEGEDYLAASKRLEWGANDSSDKFLEVQLLDDNESEGDESIGLVLTDPVGAVLGAIPRATLTILDQDSAQQIEALGSSTVALRPGADVELQVQVSDDQDRPIAGAQVHWELVPTAGATSVSSAELVGGPLSTSDSQGIATKKVSLGSGATQLSVIASLPDGTQPVVFELVVGDLVSLFDPGTGERSVAEALDASCRSGSSNELDEVCAYLFSLTSDAERRSAVEQLVPREVASQATHTLDMMVSQLRMIADRISSVRKGDRARVDSQLALQIGDDVIENRALQTLASSLLGPRPGGSNAALHPGTGSRLARAIDRALDIGEAPMLDKAAQPDPALDALVKTQPWGFFVNGRYSSGDRRASQRESGYDFDSVAITMAADYRLDDRFLVGAAANFIDTSSDLVGDGGGLEADNKSLTLYGSIGWKRAYLDAIVLYGKNDYTLVRNIDLPQPFVSADPSLDGRTRFAARSDSSGDQFALNTSLGVDLVTGATNLSAFVRGYYLDSTIDAFSESGAGPFDMTILEQDLDSLLAEAGFELTYNASLSWGILQPALRVSYLHEFEDDARRIRGRFSRDPSLALFVVPTDFPDSDFLNVGASITAVLPRGRSVFLAYDTDLEREFVDLETFTGGFRFSF